MFSPCCSHGTLSWSVRCRLGSSVQCCCGHSKLQVTLGFPAGSHGWWADEALLKNSDHLLPLIPYCFGTLDYVLPPGSNKRITFSLTSLICDCYQENSFRMPSVRRLFSSMSSHEGDSTPCVLVMANRADMGSALMCLPQWRMQDLTRSGESRFPGSLEQCGSLLSQTLHTAFHVLRHLDLTLSRDCATESESGNDQKGELSGPPWSTKCKGKLRAFPNFLPLHKRAFSFLC